MFTLPPNTGTYTLTFDMACLGGWGNSEVAAYALHNPPGADASFPPTGAFTPDNMNLFPAGSTFLLNTIPVNATNCTSTKTNQSVTINTNDARFMGFDNFCLAVSSDCPASYLSNGDLAIMLVVGLQILLMVELRIEKGFNQSWSQLFFPTPVHIL